jgi:pimeloyl-ACP methyl ester carboxylesterase
MANDHRLFDDYLFDTTLVRPTVLHWPAWQEAKGFADYAKLLIQQVDTTAPFVLLGFSMGGMLAQEMSKIIQPEAIIIVSSVRAAKHLPFRTRVGKFLPIYRLISEGMVKQASGCKWFFKQIREAKHVRLYQSMVAATGAKFLKWQICATVHWDYAPSPTSPQLYHIHGEKDKAIPLRKGAKPNVVIPGGSHEIIVNELGQITKLVEGFIKSLHSF